MKLYKLSKSQLVEMPLITTMDLEGDSGHRICAGSRVRVTHKHKGLNLYGPICPSCGNQFYMTSAPYDAVQVDEDPQSNITGESKIPAIETAISALAEQIAELKNRLAGLLKELDDECKKLHGKSR